jgi:ABC-2 type transport system permease protein
MPSLIIALREYRQLTSTRSFWITLLAIPLLIGFLGVLPSLFSQPPGNAYLVLDRTGIYAERIASRVEFAYQRVNLRQVIGYAKECHVLPERPDAAWAPDGQWLNDDIVERFMRDGGVAAAVAEIDRKRGPDSQPFRMSPRRLLAADVPSDIGQDLSADGFRDAVKPYLDGKIATSQGDLPLMLAVYIPPDFGKPGASVRIWTNGRADFDVINLISGEIGRVLRANAAAEAGLPHAEAASIERAGLPISLISPAPENSANRFAIKSILPLALGYLLLMTVIVTGTMMLQGVIEERSNKLVETILACVSAQQFMCGKLIGVGAVGLTILIIWLGCAVGASFAMAHEIVAAFYVSLAGLQSPIIILSMIFYFCTGYLSTSIVFLTIGAMSDSMQDAQGYLMPLIMLLSGPFVALIMILLNEPDSSFPVILSWIPLYTPFAMLARLGIGVSPAEIIGTAALMLLFLVGEFVLLGRVFRVSLLRSGQPPRLLTLLRLMRAERA